MNVLFIGATGNISTACAALLHKREHHILALTRGREPVPPSYTSLLADRRDAAAMRRALRGVNVDVVINFTGYTVADLEVDYELFKDQIKQYIFISSASVYRKPHELPLTENSPLGNEFSEYAQNKERCEAWLAARYHQDQFPMTIVRPSHTYSPRWIPNVVSSAGYTLLARLERNQPVFIHDDGQSLWTLTAAADFAIGLAGLVGRNDAIGETFHITSDEVLTWNQIYAEICRATDIKTPNILHIPTEFICNVAPAMIAKLKGDKAAHGVFDNAKIKRYVPDYEARKSFRQGITEAVTWFRANPSRVTLDEETNRIFERVTSAWQATH